jgi:spore coat polysaccharide biosynthesis protein SpsF (cytidylyltransferase family)
MTNILAILQAIVSSSRLFGKVLKPIMRRSMLSLIEGQNREQAVQRSRLVRIYGTAMQALYNEYF